jgi:predicted negative regulator of RcsB-dependent stress response
VDEYLDDKEQWQRVVTWLREQGPWIVGGVALAAAGIGGWRWWQQRQETRAVQAGTLYEQVIDAYSRNDLSGGDRLTDQLVSDFGSSAYADQAELASARIDVERHDSAKAIARLSHVTERTRDPQLALLARLRLARVQVDAGKADDALKTLSVEAGAFDPRYAEVRGDALLAKGDRNGALEQYRTARAAGATGAAGADTVDADLLDLKIRELAKS